MGYKFDFKSKSYKNVYKVICTNSVNATKLWCGYVLGKSKLFLTEREAAKFVDMRLIENGKEPINVMKRLTNE